MYVITCYLGVLVYIEYGLWVWSKLFEFELIFGENDWEVFIYVTSNIIIVLPVSQKRHMV